MKNGGYRLLPPQAGRTRSVRTRGCPSRACASTASGEGCVGACRRAGGVQAGISAHTASSGGRNGWCGDNRKSDQARLLSHVRSSCGTSFTLSRSARRRPRHYGGPFTPYLPITVDLPHSLHTPPQGLKKNSRRGAPPRPRPDGRDGPLTPEKEHPSGRVVRRGAGEPCARRHNVTFSPTDKTDTPYPSRPCSASAGEKKYRAPATPLQ